MGPGAAARSLPLWPAADGEGVGRGGRRGLLDARRRIIVLPGHLFHGEKWESILPTGPLSRACGDIIQVSKRTHGPLTWADVAFLTCQSADKKKNSFPQPKIRRLATVFKAVWTVSAAVLMLDVSGTQTHFMLNGIYLSCLEKIRIGGSCLVCFFILL